jgi:hypothetical protein
MLVPFLRNNSPPLKGGDIGEGDIFELFTPTSILPRQGGRRF